MSYVNIRTHAGPVSRWPSLIGATHNADWITAQAAGWRRFDGPAPKPIEGQHAVATFAQDRERPEYATVSYEYRDNPTPEPDPAQEIAALKARVEKVEGDVTTLRAEREVRQ